jgi:tartrate dehydrogenase/decarboxylase/D-malate dehydrogenase
MVQAIEKVVSEPDLLTPDMGGRATTKELGGAVAEVIRGA